MMYERKNDSWRKSRCSEALELAVNSTKGWQITRTDKVPKTVASARGSTLNQAESRDGGRRAEYVYKTEPNDTIEALKLE